MSGARKPAKRVRESDPPEWVDEDDDQLPEPATRGAIRPIRDVDDRFVFRFEIGPAILAQLREKLERIPLVSISDALDAKYAGFYQIFVAGEPKYIGKTARPIGQRLREHARKLAKRRGIDFATVTCRYAFVEDPSLVDVAEGALIEFFGAQGLAEWNTSGFGSKVTGHGRGAQAASEWAQSYPPDLDAVVEIEGPEVMSLFDLVRQVKSGAPITLSVPRKFVERFAEDHPMPIVPKTRKLPFAKWVAVIEEYLHADWMVRREAESWYVVPRSGT